MPDPAKDGAQPCPPTAQHATRQGRRVGRNVAAVMGAQAGEPQPFKYKTRGVFVDMGRQRAVAQTMGIKWSGFPAFVLARAYYISEIPGLGRKLRLLTDWTVGMLLRLVGARANRTGPESVPGDEGRGAARRGQGRPGRGDGKGQGEGETGGNGSRENDEAQANGAEPAWSRTG